MGSNLLYRILSIVLSVPAVVFAFTVKGFGQAFVSDKLGDPTPRNNGRLSLNPMDHIDLFGFIFILLFGFGWCKPVPTSSRFYKHFKRDKALVSISGPLFLILGGFVMSFFAALFTLIYKSSGSEILSYVVMIFEYASLIPVSLAFFYLLPLPGLDGYNFITTFTPVSWNGFLYKVEKYSLLIFIGFILLLDYTNIGFLIQLPAAALSSLFSGLWALIFRI